MVSCACEIENPREDDCERTELAPVANETSQSCQLSIPAHIYNPRAANGAVGNPQIGTLDQKRVRPDDKYPQLAGNRGEGRALTGRS